MNAQSCLGFFANNTADNVLMDINLPDTSGVELCAIMKEKYPGIFILGRSTFNQGLYIKKMMENGASGYILKNYHEKNCSPLFMLFVMDAFILVEKQENH
jgi:DNA-binding NarL/FixJ family response regulator